MTDVVLRVSFELRADPGALADALAQARLSRTLDEFKAEAVDNLRDDLEREIGSDWEPFDRTPFEITLELNGDDTPSESAS